MGECVSLVLRVEWEWEAGIGGKREGTEEARRAKEMVCWARVMVGGGYNMWMMIGRDGKYMALMLVDLAFRELEL